MTTAAPEPAMTSLTAHFAPSLTTAALKAEIAGTEQWLATYGTYGALSAATKRKLASLKAELATR